MTASDVLVLEDKADLAFVEALADTEQWSRVADLRRSHIMMASIHWRVGEVEIGYYEDHSAEVRYLRVEGRDAPEFADRVRELVPHLLLDDLLHLAAKTIDVAESIRCLSRLGVVAPATADSRFTEVWQDKLRHAERAVRRAAIRTAYALPWAAMINLVRARLDHEHHLRPQLEDLLAFYEMEKS